MLSNLTSREKNTLAAGACLLLIILVAQVAVVPALEEKQRLQRLVTVKHDALKEMMQLRDEYRNLEHLKRSRDGMMPVQDKGFSLFSFLDDQAREGGVKDNVAYMKPSVSRSGKPGTRLSTVKLKLDALYLKEFIDFLYRLETAPQGVAVKSLSLALSGKESRQLEAVLETQALIAGDAP